MPCRLPQGPVWCPLQVQACHAFIARRVKASASHPAQLAFLTSPRHPSSSASVFPYALFVLLIRTHPQEFHQKVAECKGGQQGGPAPGGTRVLGALTVASNGVMPGAAGVGPVLEGQGVAGEPGSTVASVSSPGSTSPAGAEQLGGPWCWASARDGAMWLEHLKMVLSEADALPEEGRALVALCMELSREMRDAAVELFPPASQPAVLKPSECAAPGPARDKPERRAAAEKALLGQVPWPADQPDSKEGPPVAVCHCEGLDAHAVPAWHPESPARVSNIMHSIQGLAPDPRIQLQLAPQPVPSYLLPLVHSPMYLRRLQEKVEQAEAKVPVQFAEMDADTFVCAASLKAAKLAAGVVCHGVDVVMGSTIQRAFCCVRPPGHHAGRRGGALGECGQGFCLLNNVAIAATHVRVQHPHVRKICIVDIDVHHGNGTEEIFQHDDEVLFLSVHRQGDETFYPKCREARESHETDKVSNIALARGFGSAEFRGAITGFLARAEAFQPHLLLVSAGFDAHVNDPLGGCLLTEEDYHWASQQLKCLATRACGGRMVSVLEGGYDVTSLTSCVLAHVCGLAAKRCPSHDMREAVAAMPAPAKPAPAKPTSSSPPATKAAASKAAASKPAPRPGAKPAPKTEKKAPSAPAAAPRRNTKRASEPQSKVSDPPAKVAKQAPPPEEEEPDEEDDEEEEEIVNWVQCSKCDKWRRLAVDQATVEALPDDWDCGAAPLRISCSVPEDAVESSETDAGQSEEEDDDTEWGGCGTDIVRYLMVPNPNPNPNAQKNSNPGPDSNPNQVAMPKSPPSTTVSMLHSLARSSTSSFRNAAVQHPLMSPGYDKIPKSIPKPNSNPNPNPNPNPNRLNCSIPVLTLTVKHEDFF